MTREDLLRSVLEYIGEQGGGEGGFATPVPGLTIITSSETILPLQAVYRPSLCVVLQGAKEIVFGEGRLEYSDGDCLIVTLEVPAAGRIIEASPGRPYVGLTLDFDVFALREVIEQMDIVPGAASGESCVFVSKADAVLNDCFARLLRMAASPDSIPILYSSTMKEIYYWLVSGPEGGQVARLALPDTNAERVVRAIATLHKEFARPIRIGQLSQVANMSLSSFHSHFKAVTGMSPLQFQKQLRLLEARRLMMADALPVAQAAFEVGYESASQFSREYSREFGRSPKQDVMLHLRIQNEFTHRGSSRG